MEHEEKYMEAASHALAGFQIIEAGLKDYILEYHHIVQGFLPDQMRYEYSLQDIEGLALGRLVTTFSRMNDNASLIKSLQKLKTQRDDLAHRALTKLYGRERETFKFEDHIDNLVDLANDLGFLMEDLIKEHIKLIGFKNRAK